MTRATVLSVNVGGIREFDYHGRPAQSAIWKNPAEGRVAARGVNLVGDDQADRKAHGGPDKAIYAYAVEDLRWFESELGRELGYATFGENLTTEGIDVNEARVGERWRVGSLLLEVSEPRIPCWRLGVRMDDPRFIKQFSQAERPGSYLRIVEEGDVGAGDTIEVVERPDHPLSIREFFHIFTSDRSRLSELLEVPGVSKAWTDWAEEILAKKRDRKKADGPGCC